MRPLAERQYDGKHVGLTPALRSALLFWKRILREAVGRPIPFMPEKMAFHVVVTDGEGTGSVAAGWWQPRNEGWRPRVTRGQVPTAWRRAWQRREKGVDINEVEAVGPLLAWNTWPDLSNGMLICFIDNEAAKGTLIRGSSSVLAMNIITHHTWELFRKRALHAWVERVATDDNPIDKASRGDVSDLYDQQWDICDPVWPTINDWDQAARGE